MGDSGWHNVPSVPGGLPWVTEGAQHGVEGPMGDSGWHRVMGMRMLWAPMGGRGSSASRGGVPRVPACTRGGGSHLG